MPEPPAPGSATRLIDRETERRLLDQVLAAVRGGESRALVLYGEAGVGKTELLEYLSGRASDAGCRVVSAAGVESEMELAFASLHQLCTPLLDQLSAIPKPQQDALSTTFGLISGPPPDRFLVGLAVLSLLAQVAAEAPLVCTLDDSQWLDGASAQVLAFVARRLGSESVAMVFADRVTTAEMAGLPNTVVEGLADEHARALLGSVVRGPVDPRVRDEIVAETRGNPLALLELPRGMTAAQLAGGFGLPRALGLSARIEESFRGRAKALPPEARRLLLLAAAEPLGDPVLLWRAASRLGISAAAAPPVERRRPDRLWGPGPFPPPAGALSGLPVVLGSGGRRRRARAVGGTGPGTWGPSRRRGVLAKPSSGPASAVVSRSRALSNAPAWRLATAAASMRSARRTPRLPKGPTVSYR